MGERACIIASGYHDFLTHVCGRFDHMGDAMSRSSLAIEAEIALLELVPPDHHRKRLFVRVGEILGINPRTIKSISNGERNMGDRLAMEAAPALRDHLYEKARRLKILGDTLNAEIIQSKRQMEQDARRPDNSHAAGLALARRQVAQDSRLGSSQSQATHAHGRPMRPNARAFAHHVRSHEAAA